MPLPPLNPASNHDLPKGWQELGSLPRGSRLLDACGEVASRWRAALDAGVELPACWVLDKKSFRRALDVALPPGHRVGEILADRSAARRASKAARAFVRVREAAEDLLLPEWPQNTGSVLLWSSPVVRPRGTEVPSLVAHLQVEPEPEQVRRGIGRLWAFLYLGQCLREMAARGVKSIDLVVGLTALSAQDAPLPLVPEKPSTPNVESWTALLTEHEPAPTGFPMPGRSRDCLPESALSVSLGASSARAWRRVLGGRWGRSLAAVVQMGPGRWQWDAERLLASLPKIAPTDAIAVGALLGLPRDVALGQRRARRGPELMRVVPRELLRQSRLLAQVGAHERSTREALAGLIELDLAVLPDDGLKRTLEDAMSLERDTTRLVAEATLSAERLVACCETIVPGSGLLVDAGLDALPWVTLLAEWEERLEVVRHDAECREALLGAPAGTGWQALPEGPGRRALQALATRLGVFARRPMDPACPRLQESETDLVELVRWALPSPVDVLGRCRAARFEADRSLAASESQRRRLVGPTFGALRAVARDAVLLRERIRILELEVGGLLRRIALDVDRRLRRLEAGLPPGAAFDCTAQELLEAVDLRGNSLAARVSWRRVERERFELRPEPWYPARLAVEEAATKEEGHQLLPVAPGSAAGAVAVTSLDGLWLLRLGYVRGVIVRWASPGDSTAVLARALGVPVLSTGGLELPRGVRAQASGSLDGRLNPEPREGSWR